MQTLSTKKNHAFRLPLLAAATVGSCFISASLHAATFNVNTLNDTNDSNIGNSVCADSAGQCSLRAAIEEASALGNNSIVNLPAGRYLLNKGYLQIKNSLFLKGAGRATTFIDAQNKSRAIVVSEKGTSHISDLVIEKGFSDGFGQGGAGISVGKGASLNLSNAVVQDCKAYAPGGGVANGGYLHIMNSTITRNKTPMEEGGGVQYSGGGIMNYTDATLKIDNSTISYNEATRGGGMRNAGGRMEIINSTISNNSASKRGGGIMHYGITYIAFSTIAYNKANSNLSGSEFGGGGGIYADKDISGNISIGNSILAGNTDNRTKFDSSYGPDCYIIAGGRFTSFRGNVVGIKSPSCALKDSTWGDSLMDQVGSADLPLDAKINVLSNNGGNNNTIALKTGSPALDKGNGVTSATFFNCPSKDARGETRSDGKCDAGAFEYKPFVPSEPVTPSLAGVYNLVIRNSNKCLDVRDVSTANGAQLQQWDCGTGANQKFRLTAAGGDSYTIKAEHSGKCLSVRDSGLTNGVSVIQWDCFASANQKVTLKASTGGSYKITWAHSGKCMDVKGTDSANGLDVMQWDCVNVADQDWFLRK